MARGTHEIDFSSYPVKSNSVFFIKPGQVHQLEMKAGCSGFLMEFNAEFLSSIKQSRNSTFKKGK
jgi:AraC family transcriptional activator of pobA